MLYRTAIAAIGLACGCASPPVEADDYIDLDSVLEVWTEALTALDATTAPAAARPHATNPSPVRDRLLKTALDARLQAIPDRLQVPQPVGVSFTSDGALQGFGDLDRDHQPTPGEPLLFRLVVDLDRRRLLAVDLVHPTLMRAQDVADGEVGLATAYALGRMRHAQQSRAVSTDAFGNWNLSEAGYHDAIPGAQRYQADGTPETVAARR